LFFFFSSRRRHTRFSRDWSSDVCSSDLAAGHSVQFLPEQSIIDRVLAEVQAGRVTIGVIGALHGDFPLLAARNALEPLTRLDERSEERHVGKECRSRGSPQHYEKTG